MTRPIQPDLEWYRERSRSVQLPSPRCPFASLERCPRFYQSTSLLGVARLSTHLDPTEDQRLLRMWQNSDLWPRASESMTSVGGGGDDPTHLRNFCPEVAFERFGVFAGDLSRYADEIDRDVAHRRLASAGAAHDDWRWSWTLIVPMHFADCPLYSPLLAGGSLPSWLAMSQDKSKLDPFRIVVAVVGDSDVLVRVVNAAGLRVDLSEPQGSTNKTRLRTYVPRIFAAYDDLSEGDQMRAATAAVGEVQRAVPAAVLDAALHRAGWALRDGQLVVASEETREMFFPKGSQWDAFVVLRDILATAKQSVMIVDAYCNQEIFPMLATRKLNGLAVKILCSRYAAAVAAEAKAFMAQHSDVTVEVRSARDFHDRFVVVDERTCIHVGASLKDAGKTAFMVSRVEDESNRSALLAAVQGSWAAGSPVT